MAIFFNQPLSSNEFTEQDINNAGLAQGDRVYQPSSLVRGYIYISGTGYACVRYSVRPEGWPGSGLWDPTWIKETE